MNASVFETARLRVRRWRDEDIDALEAIYGDAEAMRWVGDGRAITRDECGQWLDVTRANYAKRGYGMFAVERHAEEGVIGCCGIVHPNGQREPELKYAYQRASWGQGIATEALIGLMQYGIRHHGLRHFIATTAPENLASHRVLLKAGFRYGELKGDEDGLPTQFFEFRCA